MRLEERTSSAKARSEESLSEVKEELEKSRKLLVFLKKQLQTDLKTDEEQLQRLVSVSDNAINILTTAAIKGDKILDLKRLSRKLENVDDRFRSMFLPEVSEEISKESKKTIAGCFEEAADLAQCLERVTWGTARVKVAVSELKKEKTQLSKSNGDIKTRMKVILDSELPPSSFKERYPRNFSLRVVSARTSPN